MKKVAFLSRTIVTFDYHEGGSGIVVRAISSPRNLPPFKGNYSPARAFAPESQFAAPLCRGRERNLFIRPSVRAPVSKKKKKRKKIIIITEEKC